MIAIIPKEVNICGVPYEVVLCADSFDTDTHLGQIEYKDSIIKLNEEIKEPMMMQTLCHEIVHGMLIHLGYADLSSDEQFVQAMAMAIHQSFDVKGSK